MRASSEDTDADTSGSYAWCSWHRAFTNTGRLIDVPASHSDAPGLFACSTCRQMYSLTPTADQA